MATATPNMGTITAFTFTLNALATDATAGGPFVGRASTVLDNTGAGLDAIDIMVSGIFTASGTAPTAGKQIEVWAYATYDGTSYTGGATGTDAALTTNARNKPLMRLVTIIGTDATASATYPWGPYSLAQVFGGIVPQKVGLFVAQNMGQALNAAGNTAYYQAIKFESA